MGFFVRGVGKLQEHHLKDYFQQFGEVVEATLVRDKKTKRPRGMALVTVAARDGASEAELVDKLSSETHTVNDAVLEIEEALPNPKQEAVEETKGGAQTSVTTSKPAAKVEEAPAVQEDPQAANHAQ